MGVQLFLFSTHVKSYIFYCITITVCSKNKHIRDINSTRGTTILLPSEDVHLVEFMYLVYLLACQVRVAVELQ